MAARQREIRTARTDAARVMMAAPNELNATESVTEVANASAVTPAERGGSR